jgi:putative flippase GtrA
MRLVGSMFVSIGTTALSAVILVTLVLGFGVSAGKANAMAVCCGIGPSYVGNRRFVWRRSGPSNFLCDIVPFWALSLAGLIVSTWTVAVVAGATSRWSSSSRAVALPTAHVAGFGALWIVQFMLLDRVIFRDRRSVDIAEAPGGDVSIHGESLA